MQRVAWMLRRGKSMSDEKSKSLQDQIETQPNIERSTTVCCSSCGTDIDLAGQPMPTQIINGIEVRGRIYCQMCKQVGAMKEGWMPQSGGRIAKMFVVK
jgi:hypothetical protein